MSVKLDRETDDLVDAQLDLRRLHVHLVLGDLVSRPREAAAEGNLCQ